MAEETFRCETSEQNGWSVWSVAGRLDRMTAPEAEEEAGKVFGKAEKFAIDMAGLEYLSSAGIRVLLRLLKAAKSKGKAFAICAPEGMVKTILQESRVDMLATIYPTIDKLP